MKLLVSGWVLFLLLGASAGDLKPGDKLWEYRNLGKAFYENPDTHQQATEQLHLALEAAPDSVRERVNYGLALLRSGQLDAGMAELQKVQRQDPSLPHTWFNLGIAYKHAGDYERAIQQFEGMVRLTPTEPAAHYNLASVLRSKGDSAGALQEFLQAEKLNPDLAGPHFQLFTLYQRAHDTEKAGAERKLFEEAKKRNDGAAVPEDMEWCFYAELYDPPEPRSSVATQAAKYRDQLAARGLETNAAHMALIDAEANGHSDLLVWSPQQLQLLKRGQTPSLNTGLAELRDIRDVAVGDFDNDGKPDLCVLAGDAALLYRNLGGRFEKVATFPSRAAKAVWLDFDHDNDLDLLLFGTEPMLLRNNGESKFEAHTDRFPFVKGQALDAVVTALRGDTAGRDVIVSYADRAGTIYKDKLNGVYEALDLASLPLGANALSAQDVDRDGLLDLVSYAPQLLVLRNTENDVFQPAPQLHPPADAMRADFNSDGREDYARFTANGELHLFLNDSPQGYWLAVRIDGVKNLKTAANATVEVKAGGEYEKRLYNGVPLAFALGDYKVADTIRITWPNGLIQNETQQKENSTATARLLSVPEAQRLSGSCPMIFTWNGERFEFITDVLGVAPLGASAGDGHYFPVDHDEFIQIPGRALQAENGRYRVHITEELHEISYLDQVELIALDHPSHTRIYTNDKFKSPPYPEFRLYGSEHPLHAVHAEEDGHIDVTAQVSATDQRYPDHFSHNVAGVAKLHTLDLDFGKVAASNHAVLVLNGWVDWADGSTFLGAAQSGNGLVFPSIQVKDKSGKWQTVVADMGIPSGKPKTIAVDLTGKFLSADRSVRIVTNLCVYWDEVSLLENSAAPAARLTRLPASSADLQFRGFSQALIDPARQQPEQFLYDVVHPVSNWNPTPGRYTRYGDVRSLVTSIDDKLLIMGSGDEVKLEYSAASLPPLPEGWTRDFLLKVDGWAKDADANTAFSQSVLPLPFHRMSAYPYSAGEHFPSDPDHQRYVDEYLTRPALQLIRPLASVRYR